MKLDTVLDKVVNESGMSKAAIAKKAGKVSNFAYNVRRSPNPTAHNVSALLNACGYSLCLVKPEDAPESAIRITMEDE